jgi:hypothetical protein
VASDVTIQNAINFASAYVKQQPMLVNNLEPALTAGQIILQKMLGPPMIWRFNRANFTLAITSAGTDYAISLPTLGEIETQWLEDVSGKIYELNGELALARPTSTDVRRPKKVAPVYDDNAGNITFRFDAWPDQSYTMYCDYQRKAPLLLAPGQTLAPVPDEFAYIFNTLFLGWMAWLVNDARAPIWINDGMASLLNAQAGLTAQERDIFVADYLNTLSTVTRARIAAGGAQTAGSRK